MAVVVAGKLQDGRSAFKAIAVGLLRLLGFRLVIPAATLTSELLIEVVQWEEDTVDTGAHWELNSGGVTVDTED